MKQTFEINLFDNHLIVDVDGKTALIDTGSPSTLSNSTFDFLSLAKN